MLLADTSAPAGTYSNVVVTFSNPSYTIKNTSSGTLTLPGSKTCATQTVCTVTPTLTQVSTTTSTSPFPLTLTANTPVTLNIDLNANKSISATDFSVNPSVTVSAPATLSNGNLTAMTINGQVTQTGANQFTVTDATTGMPFSFTTNGTTTFNNFAQNSTTCTTANTAACLAQNQNVAVNFGIASSSPKTLTATGVSLQSGVTSGVTGVVTAVNPGANQFTIVTTGVSPSVTTGAAIGQQFVVTVPTTASAFAVQNNGLTIPSGVGFTGINNVAVGQTVLVNASSISGSNITANQTILMPSQFTGTVSSVNGTNLVVNGLNGVFTGAGVNSLNVTTQTATTFPGGITRLSGLTVGAPVTVGGLIFTTSTGDTVVGGQILN